jgi:SPOR domain
MADRYQDRPYPAGNDYDSGGDPHAPARGEADPLAELARLIGQTDPFAMGRANQRVQPRSVEREEYQEPEVEHDEPAAELPPWMQRANQQPEVPPEDYPSPVHPLRRYATPLATPATDYDQPPLDDDAGEQELDPARYDEALYGQLGPSDEEPAQHLVYRDDPYTYQDSEEPEEPVRRRGGLFTAVMVLALAVVGTGAAFAYRTYVVVPRSGEPPIIKADNTPTKVVPASADASAKVVDRLAAGDGTEKIVPREEAPVDINAKAAPRVVLAPMNPNQAPPVNTVPAAAAAPAIAPNGTLPNSEPRRIKTLTVRGDQTDAAATPVTAPPPAATKPAAAARAAAPKNPPSSANASANAPLSLSPQAAQPAPAPEPRTPVAANNPVEAAPASPAAGGGYVVQVSSQRNEADAQASYKALQGKFPAVLGSHSPLIKRADLGDKGIYYRAMVGPFGTPEEASQLCGSLKTAGGQCVVQRN